MANNNIDDHLILTSAEAKSRNLVTSFYRNLSHSHRRKFGNKLHEAHNTHFDFISTLALAQERNLDFLPIKWRPDMDDDPSNILIGGTAKINQLRLNIQMSMIFKLVKVVDNFNAFDYKNTYRALYHEIAILTAPQIRGHPNFVQLDGLGWNIEDERTVPVLVFEKASCGDASRFFVSEESTHISFDERLQLCIDLGRALMLLHSCRMVHGDLKPQNVLIDRGTAGRFTAKLADFGYSLLYSRDQFHALPRSRPWNAPETSSFEINFDDAVSADIYSYAMVCLWILFQDKAVANPLKRGGTCLSLKHPQRNVATIEELKNADELKNVAYDMIAHEDALDPDSKIRLQKFFEQTLVKIDGKNIGCTARETKVQILLKFLGGASEDGAADHEGFIDDGAFPISSFQVAISLLQLSRVDYRVRKFLVSEFRKDAEDHDCSDCRENAAYQLALCYRLGFGVKRDLLQTSYWLSRSNRDGTFQAVMRQFSITLDEPPTFPFDDHDMQKPYIDVEIMFTRALGSDHLYHSPRMLALYHNYILTSINYADEYRAAGFSFLEEARNTYKKEGLDIQEELGNRHEVVFVLRTILASLMKDTGLLEEAKHIGLELYDSMKAHPLFGPEHNETVLRMNFLAEIWYAEGDFKAAKAQFQKALDIQQKTLGMEHLSTLLTLNNLAETLHDEGEHDEAEKYCSKALSGRLKVLGEQHVDTLISMNNLGTIWIAQDNLDKAEEILSQAEEISSKILGSTNYFTLTIVNNLGAVLHFQDKLTESQKKLETSLENCQIAMGPSHPATSTSMVNLSNLFLSLGDYNAARSLCQTAARNLEEKLGREHPSTLAAKNSMVLIAEADNDYQLAETLAQDLFQVSKQVLGETHTTTLNRADTLASMLMNAGKDAEAGELYQWALERKEKALGKASPQTLITVHNLANVRLIEGRYEEARQLFAQAYEGLASSRGPQHSSTLMSLSKLASVHSRMKEHETAERMAREAIEGFRELNRKSYNEDDVVDQTLDCESDMERVAVSEADNTGNSEAAMESPATLTALSILGGILERANRDAEAEPIHRYVLRGLESHFGPDNHDTLLAVSSIARVLYEQAKYAEALEMAVRAESGTLDLLGPSHPDTIVAKTNLSMVRDKLQRVEVSPHRNSATG